MLAADGKQMNRRHLRLLNLPADRKHRAGDGSTRFYVTLGAMIYDSLCPV